MRAFYHDKILPKLISMTMSDKRLAPYRTAILKDCFGDVLELGIGSGANLRFYPPAVTKLTGVEPHAELRQLALDEAKRASFPVQIDSAVAENLPYNDHTFDCVVSTLTLCSVDQSQQVLREVLRVLKPGGVFYFLEHGLSPEKGVRFWQKSLNGVQKRLGGGCQLTKDHVCDLQLAGWSEIHKSNEYLPGVPKFLGYLYRGSAVNTQT